MINNDIGFLTILAPALIAGALIGLAHIPLGIEVLRRGIIFLDLAVAQFAALGMICFHVFFENHDMDPLYASIGALLLGLAFSLCCAIILHCVEKYTAQYHEALIGSAFVLAASLSILIMAGDPHSGEQMKDILAGQILWITWSDLALYGGIFILTAGLWGILKSKRERLFYILFALIIPFSVKMIGVYLVFTSLILPALASAGTKENRILKAYLLSLSAFAAGLVLSYNFDTPTGPTIILTMFCLAAGYFAADRHLNTSNCEKKK